MKRPRQAAVTEIVPDGESDSGEDEREDELAPSEAYKQLLGMLTADAPVKALPTPNRKREGMGAQTRLKSNSGSAVRPTGCKPNAKHTKQVQNVSPGQKGSTQSGGKPEAPLEPEKPVGRRGKKVAEEPETAEPSKSMNAHLGRKLTEADIVALRDAKLAKDSSTAFQEAWLGHQWMVSGEPLPEVHSKLADYGIKQRLITLWREAVNGGRDGSDFATDQQAALFALLRSYKDVLLPTYPYPQSVQEEDLAMDATLLHCLDHVLSTAQCIKKNNESLRSNPEGEVPRDQGFTRPKVLLLLPMRSTALKVVSRLIKLAQRETRADSIQGKSRFLEEFGEEEPAERKPGQVDEHFALFSGNSDDYFRLGIKLTRGAVKLYADFFQSDVIVASPIALATKQAEAGERAPEDLDFLSSIEIVVAARCDVFLMQNWAHVTAGFEAMSQLPREGHGVDIMRVHEWYLAGQAKYYRQNILLTSFLSPEMNALFSRTCSSHAGKAKLQPAYEGVLGRNEVQLRQMFERFASPLPAGDADARLQHFKTRMWPRIRDSGSGGQLVFVPSYFDFLRLRAFFREQEVEFETFSEYASGSEVARGRARFAAGKTRIAVYTERAHFYHRRRTRGVKDLYVYQLPEHAQFYSELLEMAATAGGVEEGHTTVTVLFSKFDLLRLERIVGCERARKMLKSKTGTFLFC